MLDLVLKGYIRIDLSEPGKFSNREHIVLQDPKSNKKVIIKWQYKIVGNLRESNKVKRIINKACLYWNDMIQVVVYDIFSGQWLNLSNLIREEMEVRGTMRRGCG